MGDADGAAKGDTPSTSATGTLAAPTCLTVPPIELVSPTEAMPAKAATQSLAVESCANSARIEDSMPFSDTFEAPGQPTAIVTPTNVQIDDNSGSIFCRTCWCGSG